MKYILTIVMLTVRVLSISAHDIERKSDGALRIMSYNVHNFVGMDKKRDYGRIADVIKDVAPDVVAIQEADSATQRSGGVYTLNEVAEQTQMFAVYAPAIDYQGGRYGVGILSKEKPVSFRQTPLPGREEKRTLLIVEFEKYVVACTHFSLNNEDRLASVAIINEAVKGFDKPLFLAGDMNCEPESSPQTAMRQTFDVLNDMKQYTFPVKNPNVCIDYIYQYRNGHDCKVLNRQVINETSASDHLPLFVDVLPI